MNCLLDVLHLECLNNYASQLPPNTAPAGYVCPICTMPIFSFTPGSTKSPVGSQLEKTLADYPWAREGIGLGLMDSKVQTNADNSSNSNGILPSSGSHGQSGTSLLDDSTKINMTPTSSSNSSFAPKLVHNLHSKTNYTMSSPISVNNVTSFISTNSDLSFGSTSSMRSKFDSESRRSLLANDIVEDKYRTKSPIEFLSRWFRYDSIRGFYRLNQISNTFTCRSRSSYMRNQSTLSGIGVYKRFIIFGVIAFLFLFVLVHFFLKFGRQSAENDPFLNPKNDPNFRNEIDWLANKPMW